MDLLRCQNIVPTMGSCSILKRKLILLSDYKWRDLNWSLALFFPTLLCRFFGLFYLFLLCQYFCLGLLDNISFGPFYCFFLLCQIYFLQMIPFILKWVNIMLRSGSYSILQKRKLIIFCKRLQIEGLESILKGKSTFFFFFLTLLCQRFYSFFSLVFWTKLGLVIFYFLLCYSFCNWILSY